MKEFRPDFNRLRKVLLRQGKPDMVPFCDLYVTPETVLDYIGKPFGIQSNVEFFHTFGYDFVPVLSNFEYKHLVHDTSSHPDVKFSFVEYNCGMIENRKDLDAYQ